MHDFSGRQVIFLIEICFQTCKVFMCCEVTAYDTNLLLTIDIINSRYLYYTQGDAKISIDSLKAKIKLLNDEEVMWYIIDVYCYVLVLHICRSVGMTG